MHSKRIVADEELRVVLAGDACVPEPSGEQALLSGLEAAEKILDRGWASS